ncbi:MAG: response regulator transcription factor [Flavobacteriales bacterium]|nr:response regulator transcription factor [Flavobacteriales bacterium]MCB9447219.1 response regulator transcription factor [Flavobacteriales bacterium]
MTDQPAILLVEDDPHIAELTLMHLHNSGYHADHAETIAGGLALTAKNNYALILLDLMLPDGDGMDLCRKLRQEKDQTPIIILTAKSEEIDKVLGLESGADDYITKPFSIREFLARVKAILRRSNQTVVEHDEGTITCGDLTIDPQKRKVTLKNEAVSLTRKEFELLYLMAKNKGISYSREKLLDLIWGYQFQGYEHTVNSHINRLRSKIEETPAKPKYILTSWGVGYKFNDEY